jgi:ribosomal protein S18 acetylase RimI-like enzyme
VDKNYQKKSYGLILVKYSFTKLKEFSISEISLAVNKENEKAQRLYEKIGFTADSKSNSLRVWRYTKKL